MAFNPENKVTYKELAPSLQKILDDKATVVQYNDCNTVVAKLSAQLGPNRISITDSTNNIANPQNDKEIALTTVNNIFYSYANGWKPTGGVYS